jgi:hypothetical protein
MLKKIKKVSKYTARNQLLTLFRLDLISRCRRLRELGVEDKLKAMKTDPSQDVRDRANSALGQLHQVLDQ